MHDVMAVAFRLGHDFVFRCSCVWRCLVMRTERISARSTTGVCVSVFAVIILCLLVVLILSVFVLIILYLLFLFFLSCVLIIVLFCVLILFYLLILFIVCSYRFSFCAYCLFGVRHVM